MSNFFDTENSFWGWFGKLADALVLSLLWALCCIPVLTIAPASIALYDTIARCVHGTQEHPYKYFFHVLKTELLRGIGITVLWGALGFVLMVGYNFLYQVGKTNSALAVYAMVYLGTMLIPVGIFAWLIPLEARFTHSFFGLHKTAASFALIHLPTTGIMLGVVAVAGVLAFFAPVLILVLPGIVVTVQCKFVEKVFKRYIPEGQEESANDTAV